jgi:NADH dehydrogenase
VGHFIFVSTMGASPSHPAELFRAKGQAEERLRASGLVHTILRPAPFMDVWFGMFVELPISSGQAVTLIGESRRRHAFIAEQDVAAFAVAATCAPAARNVTIPLGGPEAVTWLDVVRAYESALGIPVATRSVPPGTPLPGLPDAVAGLAWSLETFDTIIPMADTAREFGVTLTTVAAFARSRLAVVAPGGARSWKGTRGHGPRTG